jgi:hypothetical protein
MSIIHEAYRIRYDFQKVRIKNKLVQGKYTRVPSSDWQTMGHIDDISINYWDNGNVIVANRGHVIHTFYRPKFKGTKKD